MNHEELVEAVALALLNSDREMAGLPPVESRATVPDSDGYVVNARAVEPLIRADGMEGRGVSHEMIRLFLDPKRCRWYFEDGWVFDANWLNPRLRQSPVVALWKAFFNVREGKFDHQRCVERLTPYNSEFSSKLAELINREEVRRNAAQEGVSMGVSDQ